MTNFFSPQISTVFLMMGNACNFNCKYCLQHPLVHKPLKSEVSQDLIDFLINMTNKNRYPVHLQFYGGEPLLYFPTMKEIVERLGEEKSKFSYSTITNGSLLDDEKVKWLNENGFSVGLSWDGRNTEETRRRNVLNDPVIREHFMSLDNAHISAVVSSKAYPKDLCEDCWEICKEYNERHENWMSVNFDELMDTGINCSDLLDIDYERVFNDSVWMCREYAKKLDNKDHNPVAGMRVESMINGMKNGVKCGLNFTKCACSNGYRVINVDMQGNLYHCHNGTDKYGTVHGGFWELNDAVMKWDTTQRNNARCSQCAVQSICQNGCPLISEKVREESYCKLKQAMFLPVIDFVLQLGKAPSCEAESSDTSTTAP